MKCPHCYYNNNIADSLYNENCIKQLPSAMDVYLSALLIQTIIYTLTTDPTERSTSEGFIYLFSSNPFNTTGSITSWVFAAQTRTRLDSSANSFQLPQLQIWRMMAGAYTLNSTTMIDTEPPILLGALNMYRHKLNPPASYEEDDIIGIYQPSNENAALQIAFVDSKNTALQAIVRPTTLASTGNIRVGPLSTGRLQPFTVITILPLMTLSTKVAIEPSQTHFSTKSAQQLSLMSSLDQSRAVRQPSVSLDQRSQTLSATQGSPTRFQELPLPSPTVEQRNTSKFYTYNFSECMYTLTIIVGNR